jgi:hypothetical protein
MPYAYESVHYQVSRHSDFLFFYMGKTELMPQFHQHHLSAIKGSATEA